METATVFVVDDDQLMGESIVALLTAMGTTAKLHRSAEEFLATYNGQTLGCVVSDLRLTGMTGLELQEQMRAKGWTIPVVLISAFPKARSIVRGMLNGAITFLEKPLDEDVLWKAIRDATAHHLVRHAEQTRLLEMQARFAELTEQERGVLGMMIQGNKNKEIAEALDVSIRTIESRRRQIFDKTQTNSLAELVRFHWEVTAKYSTGTSPMPAPRELMDDAKTLCSETQRQNDDRPRLAG